MDVKYQRKRSEYADLKRTAYELVSQSNSIKKKIE